MDVAVDLISLGLAGLATFFAWKSATAARDAIREARATTDALVSIQQEQKFLRTAQAQIREQEAREQHRRRLEEVRDAVLKIMAVVVPQVQHNVVDLSGVRIAQNQLQSLLGTFEDELPKCSELAKAHGAEAALGLWQHAEFEIREAIRAV